MEKTTVLKHRIKNKLEDLEKLIMDYTLEDGEHEKEVIRRKQFYLINQIYIQLEKIKEG